MSPHEHPRFADPELRQLERLEREIKILSGELDEADDEDDGLADLA